MNGRDFNFHDGKKGAALAIRVEFSKGESSFSKVLKDGTVIVKLARSKGELNEMLIDFLSRELSIPKKRLGIIAGEDGNKKLISIEDMAPRQIQNKILEMIS